jgi:hypothetical protein
VSVRAFSILACIGRFRATSEKKANQSGFLSRALESEDGKTYWPIYMANGLHRGDGLIILHDARKSKVPAYPTV